MTYQIKTVLLDAGSLIASIEMEDNDNDYIHYVQAKLLGLDSAYMDDLTILLSEQTWPTNRSAKFKFRATPLLLVEDTQLPNSPEIWDWELMQYIDPRSLAEIKEARWAELKLARTQAESEGFTWDGSIFDSDPSSQARINGAVTLALIARQLNQPYEVTWTLKNSTTRTLSIDEMIAVGLTLGNHVQTIFNKGQLLQQQINQATTKEEVTSIVW